MFININTTGGPRFVNIRQIKSASPRNETSCNVDFVDGEAAVALEPYQNMITKIQKASHEHRS